MTSKAIIDALQAAKQVARDKYAWPGGYPLFLVTEEGGCLCPTCVKAEYREIASATIRNDRQSGWCAAGSHINYEDSQLYCDHCGKRIESAYGEDETQDDS